MQHKVFWPLLKYTSGLLRCTEQSLKAGGPLGDATAFFEIGGFSESSVTDPSPSGERNRIRAILRNHGG